MATRWTELCMNCGQACHYTGATWIDGRRLCKNCRLLMVDRLKEFDELGVLLSNSHITLDQLIKEWVTVARTVNEHRYVKDTYEI